MTVTKFPGGFITEYNSSRIISSTVCYSENSIIFFLENHEQIEHTLPGEIALSTYNAQFGICISADERYFFVQSWERGLFCFDLCTGAKKWNLQLKHAYELATIHGYVLCFFSGNGLIRIDLETGTIIDRLPLTVEKYFFIPLNSKLFLIGPRRKKFLIIDYEFSIIASVNYNALNPLNHTTFIIQGAHFNNGILFINGIEYSNLQEFKNCDIAFTFNRKIKLS